MVMMAMIVMVVTMVIVVPVLVVMPVVVRMHMIVGRAMVAMSSRPVPVLVPMRVRYLLEITLAALVDVEALADEHAVIVVEQFAGRLPFQSRLFFGLRLRFDRFDIGPADLGQVEIAHHFVVNPLQVVPAPLRNLRAPGVEFFHEVRFVTPIDRD